MFDPESGNFTITVPVVFNESDLDITQAALNALKRQLADSARDEIFELISNDIREYNRRGK